jgi:hypothetical protein
MLKKGPVHNPEVGKNKYYPGEKDMLQEKIREVSSDQYSTEKKRTLQAAKVQDSIFMSGV